MVCGKSLSHKMTFKQLCHVAATSCAHGHCAAPQSKQSVLPWSTHCSLRNIKHHNKHEVPTAKGQPSAPWVGQGSLHVHNCPNLSEDTSSPIHTSFLFQFADYRSAGAREFCQAELKAAAAAVAAGRAQPEMTSPSCSSSLCIFIPGKSPAKPECSLKRPGKSIQPAGGTHHHRCITAALPVLIITGGQGRTEESRLFLSTMNRS